MSAKFVAWTASSMIALLAPGKALAQSADASARAQPQSGIEDIVVTAQKRSENLQKTAAAVTAITGSELVARGVGDLPSAQMVIPAARFQIDGNNIQVFIRGVGSNLDFANIEPSVAFNLNGVFVPREASSAAFFDLARLEVLPGPQGTLYGRGAIGGTINVGFTRPDFNEDGTATIEAGNFELVHGTLAQNFALSDQLAIRMAVDYVHRDGYFKSGAASADDVGGRLSLLYQPSDNFSAYAWAFGAKKNGSYQNVVNHSPDGFLTKNPYDDVTASEITRAIPNPPIPLGAVGAEDNDYGVFSAGGEFELDLSDAIKLVYIPGYTKLDSSPFGWVGSLLFNLDSHIETSSHELRLVGNAGAVDWIGGLFYYRQTNHGFLDNYFSGLANSFVQRPVDVRSNHLNGAGIFGQGNLRLSEALRVTLGGRYSYDRRRAEGFDPEIRLAGAEATTPWAFKKSYSYFDWKAGIEYDLASRVMIYANAQTGHSPGTYNPISQNGLTAGNYDGTIAVSKAKLTAFAGGVKSRFLDNRAQVNVEGFYYTYKGLIQQQFNASALFNPVFNADKVEVYGFQADLALEPTPADKFKTSVGYTHNRAKDFVTPSGTDFSGIQSAYAPDWTILGSYTHLFDLPNGDVDATMAARYESSWFADFTHTPGTKQEATAKVDASLTYISDRNWQVGLWGKNLTNKVVLAAAAAAGFPGPASGFLEAPRTYGIRFGFKY